LPSSDDVASYQVVPFRTACDQHPAYYVHRLLLDSSCSKAGCRYCRTAQQGDRPLITPPSCRVEVKICLLVTVHRIPSYSSFDPVASAISSSCTLALAAGKLVSDIHPHLLLPSAFWSRFAAMDLQNPAKPGSPNSLLGVPEYILNTFFPGTLPLLARSPRFAKLISLILALWWVGPSAFWRLKHFLDSFSSFFISSISVSSDEDLFEYLVRWLATQRTLRKEYSLVASLSNPSPNRKRNSYYPGVADEISPQDDLRNVDIQYESSHGLQWLLFKRRLFFMRRDFGEGNVYNSGKSHRMETLKLSCIGRSTQPIKDLLEEVYREHKDKEKSLTIIRRPFGGHYGRNGWSRISQKPRYVDSIRNLLPNIVRNVHISQWSAPSPYFHYVKEILCELFDYYSFHASKFLNPLQK
jgi:BCS1 N terminal